MAGPQDAWSLNWISQRLKKGCWEESPAHLKASVYWTRLKVVLEVPRAMSSESPPEASRTANPLPARSTEFRPSPPPTEKPFRPFSSSEDQENKAPVYHTPADSSFRLIQQSVDRVAGPSRPAVPLQGTRMVNSLPLEHHTPSLTVKALDSHGRLQISTTEVREPPRAEPEARSNTLPQPYNPPVPVVPAVTAQSKRSFLVG